MATYEDIYGKRVKEFDSDPTLDSSYEGQVWYNSATGTLRSVVAFEAWSSGSPLITARYGNAGSGTQTAGLSTGGNVGPSDTRTTATEEYNGTGFSTGGALPTATRSGGAAGTQTATIFAGGYDTANTAEAYTYNGTAWTGIPALNTARRSLDQNMAGTTTAAIIAGGYTEPPHTANSEEYNGSSWSEGNNLNTARSNCAAGGIQTASFLAGGTTGSVSNATELYDGTSWTASGNLNTARSTLGGGGLQTAGIVFGGGGPNVQTETFDGTSWTETADMATARYGGAPANQPGAQSSTFIAGGYGPGISSLTEEFNKSINTITAAAWSSGGSLNTARANGGMAGTTTAGIYMAGKVYPNTFKNETEEYNGTSWSEQNNVSTGRTSSGSGTQTAGIIFGGTNGAPGSTGVQTATEEYDGSSWTNGGALSTARLGMYGAGLQTACFGAGGIGSPNTAVTSVEDYNGSSWTSGTAMPTAQQGGGTAGLPSARLVFGGYSPYSAATLEGDGEGWTAGGNMLQARGILAGFGSQTDAIAAGGSVNPNANSALVEGYDGTSWSTRPSLATARMEFAPSGSYNTSTGGFVAGGSLQGNPNRSDTEEWNVETSTATAKTLTTS